MNPRSAVLATISLGPEPPLVETSSDPNLAVLLWLWRLGPNPFVPRGGTRTYTCATPLKTPLVRVNRSFTVYDSTVC